jgi:23S rRNA (pseudouridine1915-N3)-methyltransferase
MNIKLIVVSKTDIPYLQTGIDEYVGRLKHYCDFEIVVIPALKNLGKISAEEIKEREGQLILKQLDKVDHVVLLDEHGREYTSVGFSEYLQKQMNAGIRTIAFVIGGAFGFSPSVYAKATHKVSLSQMTFNHQMVRLFFVEQLYRAYTILHHEKYHNQ